MARDHYVPQCHLSQFIAQDLGHLLHAISKSSGKHFTPRPADVCRVPSGNSIPYLDNERAVEDFLKTVEPPYKPCVERLRAGHLDQEIVYVISGFTAYTITCSPTATRMHPAPAQDFLERQLLAMDAAGEIPKPPPELNRTSASEMIRAAELSMWVDPQYPRAIGAAAIERLIGVLGNGVWEILRSTDSNNPFFTSDFPAAIEGPSPLGTTARIVPLAPDLAVRIIPDRQSSRNYDFRDLRYTVLNVPRERVMAVNRRVVQCAEEHVFFSKKTEWAQRFVARHSRYHLALTQTRPNASVDTYTYKVVKK